MARPRTSQVTTCPCGSARRYDDCCAIVHGGLPAATAETLMRARYVAFTMRLEPFLLATWHASTRPNALRLIHEEPTPRWLGLDVRRASTDGDRAEVEFVARYKRGGGSATRMHETSRFLREGGWWYYVDGDQHES